MSIQLTLTFGSFEELAQAVGRLAPSTQTIHVNPEALSFTRQEVMAAVKQAKVQTQCGVIVHADRPDVGADPVSKEYPLGVAFGQAATAPTPPVAPPAPPAPPAPAFGQVAAPLPAAPVDAPSFAAAAQHVTAHVANAASSIAPPAPPAPAPTPAETAAAPAAPAAPSAPVPGVEMDKDGLPWDHRIHAETKGKNKDGTWRQRRNLPDGLKEQVEAQLRGLLAVNAAAVVPPPPAGDAPAAPAAPQGSNPLGALLMKIAPYLADGKITPEQCDAVAARHGAANLSQLILTPALIPAVEAELLGAVQ
jgi:hypothetical protein